MLAINFRLAPAVFSSSLPATNSDTLTGHQLKRHYVRSICGSKCKNQVNLWISPTLVHCRDFSASITEFARSTIRFDQQSARKKPKQISTKQILPAAAAAFCIDRGAIKNRMSS
ncbi:MAG: hypothetical protein P4K78_02220 [Terracidiphilus sp.]|nr:hypothetical protein [Terracidiphilus sp.]